MAQQVEILSLNINTQALLTKLSDTKKAIEQLQASQKELKDAGEGTSNQFIQQSAQLKNLQQSYNKQLSIVQQLEAADRQAASAVEAVNNALRSEIKSIDEATANNKQLRTVRNQLNLATNEGRAALDAINKKIDQNTEFIRENVSALEQQKMNIGNYADSIKQALGTINPFNGGIAGFTARAQEAGGAGNLLKESFSQLATGIGGVTKSAMTFIATPIGAAIAAIVAAFAATKQIFDYNQALQEANRELKALGVNSSELSNVREEISATAEVFNKGFKEVASTANSLAKTFGISMSEANDVIAQGLANGGAQNTEFLDSLGEYDVFFQNAGYSAEEFITIVNEGPSLGVYQDKLPDAIKEIDLSLKEQTKSTRDALVNAFGESFSNDILKRVRTGEITTKQALDEIAKKASETSLTQQQQAQLTADLGKSASEDIGGIAKVFEAVNSAAKKSISDTANAQLQLQESTERLNKAQAELFEIKGFGDMWTGIKVVATDAFAAMLEYITDVKKDIQPLIDFIGIVFANAWNTLKTTVSVAFDLIGGTFKTLSNTIGTFVNFFKAIFKGDFQGAIDAIKNGFTNLLNIVSNTFGGIKNSIIEGIKSIVSNISPILSAVGVDVDALSKKLDGLKSKSVDIKGNVDTKTTNTTTNKVVADKDPNAEANAKDAKKKIDDEAKADKARSDAKQKILDSEFQKQKDSLAFFEASQGIKKRSIEDEVVYQKEVSDKKQSILEAEFAAGKLSKMAYETAKLNLTKENALREAEVALDAANREVEIYKHGIDSEKLTAKTYSQEKLTAKIQENNSLSELQSQAKLAELEAGKISQLEYNDAINQINAENKAKNAELELVEKEAKKEQELLELENKKIEEQASAENEFELRQIQLQQRYDADYAAAVKAGKSTSLLEKQFKAESEKIESEKQNAKLKIAGDTLGQMTSLFGKESAAGKAVAISQALINTYLGISAGVKLGFPAAIGAVAAASATGFAAVKNITSTKTPSFADGGGIPKLGSGIIDNGSNIIPLSNGDDTLAYVQQGEVILNKEQQRRAGGSIFFRHIGVPGFADGGIIGGNTNLGNFGGVKIDMDALASKIGQEVAKGNASLPSPVVSVVDITDTQNNIVRIEQTASL